jgi:hypothetical protein
MTRLSMARSPSTSNWFSVIAGAPGQKWTQQTIESTPAKYRSDTPDQGLIADFLVSRCKTNVLFF